MDKMKEGTKSFLPPMGSGYLPKDSAKRLRSTMASLEDAMALMGYVPLGYISIAAFKDQVEHDASTDPTGHVSDWKLLSVLHFLLQDNEHRPAGFDALYNELVRESAKVLKMISGEKDPEDWCQEAVEAIKAGREPPDRD